MIKDYKLRICLVYFFLALSLFFDVQSSLSFVLDPIGQPTPKVQPLLCIIHVAKSFWAEGSHLYRSRCRPPLSGVSAQPFFPNSLSELWGQILRRHALQRVDATLLSQVAVISSALTNPFFTM
jgi:hypothetical protein